MVGLMHRLDKGLLHDPAGLVAAYESLTENPEYQKGTTSSTAAEDSVTARLQLATAAFATA